MRVEEYGEREAAELFDDLESAPNMIVAACDDRRGVLTPDHEDLSSSAARDHLPEIHEQRLLKVITDNHHLSPVRLSRCLVHGLDTHPLIAAPYRVADYVYWPTASDPSNFMIILWTDYDISLLLYPREKYDWRKNIRTSTNPDQAEWELNCEVFVECIDPAEVRHPHNKREMVPHDDILLTPHTQSDMALKTALEVLTVENLTVDQEV